MAYLRPSKTIRRKSLLIIPGRETYVTDKNGKIIMVFNSMNAARHTDEAIEALQSLNQ